MNDFKLKYDKYVVAFIDILGFRELIRASVSDSEEQLSAYKALLNLSALDSLQSPDHLPDLRIHIFSDSVIIALPFRQDCILDMLFVTNSVCWRLMRHGVWLRGGVTVGEAFFDDYVAFGPAIIEAYDIESRLAKYPRVVLSKSALELLASESRPIAKLRQVERDEDGVCFPNYFKAAALFMLEGESDHAKIYREDALSIKDILERKYHSVVDNPSVFEKVKWMVTKWNDVFSTTTQTEDLCLNVNAG